MANKILKGILVFIFLIFWTGFANYLQLNVIGTRGWTNVFFSFGLFWPYLVLFNAFGSGVLFLLMWRYLKSRLSRPSAF